MSRNLTLRQGEAARIADRKRPRDRGRDHDHRRRIACRAAVSVLRRVPEEPNHHWRMLLDRAARRDWSAPARLPDVARRSGLRSCGGSRPAPPPAWMAARVDFSKMEPQEGDEPVVPFSFLTDEPPAKIPRRCYLTYTTAETHRIIREQPGPARPMYNRLDPRHRRALLPLNRGQGGALRRQGAPPDLPGAGGRGHGRVVRAGHVHLACRRTYSARCTAPMPGLEHAELMRLAYAIEYDCIDPLQLTGALECQTSRAACSAPGRSTAPRAMRRPQRRACTPESTPRCTLQGEAPLSC